MSLSEHRISIEDALHDHAFQDWLFANLLFKLTDSSDNEFLPGKRTSRKMAEYFKTLAHNYGYIVPNSDLARVLFVPSDQRSTENKLDTVRAYGNDLRRRKILYPEAVFHGKGLGWGLGVEATTLTSPDIKILYRLWLDLMRPVHEVDIANDVYGIYDDYSTESLRDQVRKLRQNELSPSTARIELHTDEAERTYMLTHVNAIRKTRQERIRILQRVESEFQEWLASPELNLLVRKSPPNYYRHADLYSSKKDEVFLNILKNFAQYIVPYSSLSYSLYNDDLHQNRVNSYFRELKDKQPLLDNAYVFFGYGIGLEIEDVKIDKKQYELLYVLWRNRALSSDEIYSQLWPDDHASIRSKEKLFTLIHTTKLALAHSRVDIVKIPNVDAYTFQLLRRGLRT